jgi:hypothetical protein
VRHGGGVSLDCERVFSVARRSCTSMDVTLALAGPSGSEGRW